MASDYGDVDVMPHVSFHTSQPVTILLIAGAGTEDSSATEFFRLTIQKLPSCHIIVPFLPAQYTLPNLTSQLANLIRTEAKTRTEKGKKADVVAFSLGTHVAIYLAKEYPDVVDSVFVTGFNRLQRSKWWMPAAPYVWWSLESVGRILQVTKERGELKADGNTEEANEGEDGDGSVGSVKKERKSGGISLQTAKRTIGILSSWDELPKLKARTLIVAATKGHMGLPTGDSVESARELYDAVKLGNPESRVMEAKNGRHAWCYEQPGEFANCVRAWVDGGDEMPDFLSPLQPRQ